jgi:hypothetical protein
VLVFHHLQLCLSSLIVGKLAVKQFGSKLLFESTTSFCWRKQNGNHVASMSMMLAPNFRRGEKQTVCCDSMQFTERRNAVDPQVFIWEGCFNSHP